MMLKQVDGYVFFKKINFMIVKNLVRDYRVIRLLF